MFSNRFNTKNDPLLEAAEAAMRDGDLRRQAEGIVNEAFGVYNRKAVVNEHLADYDAAIEEVYAGLKEGVLDSIGSYLKNPTPTQKAVSGAAQGAVDKATGGMLGKLGSALSVGGSSAAPSGQTKNIREGKPNDGNLANNYPPYDKVTRGDVVAGRLGKDQMGGKRKMAEGMLDPKDPSVQGSGDVTSSARTSRPPVARKAPNDPSVQGSGDVTSRGRPVSVREEEQLDELKRSTLTSYIRKAARAKATPENISKRSKGLGLAAKKLEKLDEERKRTSAVADAFMAGKKANQKTLRTDGKTVTYHGNTIAKHEGDEVHVTTAGYGHSPSTRGHVSGILRRLGAPGLSQKKGQLYHGDKPVGSSDWIKVKKTERSTFGEDTQLDEISKRTLGSYVKKASHDVATRSAETRGAAMKADQAREKQDYMGARRHEERSNKMFNKSWKRRKGIAKAIDRLTKEDIQLDELSAFGREFAAARAAGKSQFMSKVTGKMTTTALKSPTATSTARPGAAPSAGGTRWADAGAKERAGALASQAATVKASGGTPSAETGTARPVPTINAPTTPVKKYAPSPAQQQAASDARNIRAGNSGVTNPTTTGSTGAKFAGTDAVSAPAGSAADMYGSRSIGGPRSSIPSGPTGERSTGQANITAPAPAAPKPAAKPLVKGNVSESVQIGDTKYRII